MSSSEVYSAVGGVMALAYARYKDSILYIPPGTRIDLQLDIEQVPIRENRISLGFEKDKYGRRIPEIHWRISDLDLENIRATANRIVDKWPGSKAGLPELIFKKEACDSTKPYDAYHPVGVCRMGDDPEAVVDRNLKVYGMSNLWVASTGVLRSAGTANPTFTVLCLAERLVEQLSVTKGIIG
jgi:choline dehydrogenase-like flavoprotein